MNSKELMKSACKKKGVQQVASIMNISPTALYNQMNKKEALKIREEWESLKRLLESFVLACEYGYIK